MKRYLLAIILLIGTGCSGTTLVDPSALQNLTETFKTLAIQATHHSAPNDDGTYNDFSQLDGTKMFTTSNGTMIHLEKALLSWGQIELLSDGDDEDCLGNLDQLIPLNIVENFLDDDLFTIDLGSQSINVTGYCRYTISFSPMTDAFSNHDTYHDDLMGLSLLLAGHYTINGITTPFRIEIAQGFSQTKDFMFDEDGSVMVHPFHFHENEDSRTIVFGNKYNLWFEDVDFSETEANIQQQVIVNITGTVHQHLGHHHGAQMSDDASDTGADHMH